MAAIVLLSTLSDLERCCSVYERAFTSLRESQPDAKEEAVMLLEAWRSAEAQAQSGAAEARAAAVQAVEKRMPKRIKRKVLYCLCSLWTLCPYALPEHGTSEHSYSL